MDKFNDKYRIDPNRCQLWDYSSPGNYFITLCTSGRECIFGEVINEEIILSEYGDIVKSEIINIPEYHKRVLLDTWVIMPNHVHFIIFLGNYDLDNSKISNNDYNTNKSGFSYVVNSVEKIHEFSLQKKLSIQSSENMENRTDEIKQYRKQRRKMIIPNIVGKFQMITSKQINILRNTSGKKNWQSNYHDHIIHDNESYQRIKNYIINNPKNWGNDKFKSEYK